MWISVLCAEQAPLSDVCAGTWGDEGWEGSLSEQGTQSSRRLCCLSCYLVICSVTWSPGPWPCGPSMASWESLCCVAFVTHLQPLPSLKGTLTCQIPSVPDTLTAPPAPHLLGTITLRPHSRSLLAVSLLPGSLRGFPAATD